MVVIEVCLAAVDRLLAEVAEPRLGLVQVFPLLDGDAVPVLEPVRTPLLRGCDALKLLGVLRTLRTHVLTHTDATPLVCCRSLLFRCPVVGSLVPVARTARFALLTRVSATRATGGALLFLEVMRVPTAHAASRAGVRLVLSALATLCTLSTSTSVPVVCHS